MVLSKTEQIIGTIISCFALVLLQMYLLFGTLGSEQQETVLMGIGICLLLTFSICFVILYRLRKQGKLMEVDYLNVGTQRYLLGLFTIFYGLPKLFGNFFDYQLYALDKRLIDVSEFELAWYYYGKNHWQELFSGILEFVPGVLLFFRRTYYAAALVLIFVTSQVFILNLFFKIGGITFPAATVLLACNVYIIYSKKQDILAFFRFLKFSHDLHFNKGSRTALRILKSLMLVLVILVVFIKTNPVLSKNPNHARYKELVGKYTLKKVNRDGNIYNPGLDSTLYKDLYIEKQSRWNILRTFNDQSHAFILKLNPRNDSLRLYINRGGIGDDPDIIDSLTVLEGTYHIKNSLLHIKGVQLNDTLDLTYEKQDLKAKEWFW